MGNGVGCWDRGWGWWNGKGWGWGELRGGDDVGSVKMGVGRGGECAGLARPGGVL